MGFLLRCRCYSALITATTVRALSLTIFVALALFTPLRRVVVSVSGGGITLSLFLLEE